MRHSVGPLPPVPRGTRTPARAPVRTGVVFPGPQMLRCRPLGRTRPARTKDGSHMEKKARLGRGLDALIGNGDGATPTQTDAPLDAIERNPYQPRKEFDDAELNALSASIRSHGVLQPLVVRQVGDHFQLVAGERRLRAAKAA